MLSAMVPKMIGTMVWKNSRSFHQLTAQSRPLASFGGGPIRSISARITWVSQKTSAPIWATGVRR